MKRLFSKFEKGQGLTEYALILMLVAVVVLVVCALLGPSVNNMLEKIKAEQPKETYLLGEYCNSDSLTCFVMKEKQTPGKNEAPKCPVSQIINDTRFDLKPNTCRFEVETKR